MFRIAIDIGGTFTDIVAESAEGLTSVKVLTSANDPERAALDGVDRVLTRLGKTHADIDSIVHGTTLATNALIERRGAKTAFLTTAGFRDVLAMRYEKRFEQYSLDIEMPEPLVPRPLRLGIKERILADGAVLTAPDDADIASAAETIRREKVEAVAIGFLHSFKDPSHERYVAERLRPLIDDSVTICLSSEVAGEIREFERFSTVCANAYIRPLVSRYLERLVSSLKAKGFDGSFLMMLSDGALTTLDQAMRFPIRLAEGGPAGGVALAAHVARRIGAPKVLSLDIGGTTAKICFIQNGEMQTNRQFEVARAWRDVKGSGLPVNVPTVELVEIGAGGGSIASVDVLGRLKVGPKSASSEPGPAAYGRGGDAATITDAHLTLGNIAAEGFAGGVIELTPERAPEVIRTDVQTPLGMATVEPAAAGIVELADETMANAARVHGIELGLDISSFDLLVSGGGGGLHGARIAEKLGISRIIVPENAGVGSAVGFLHSPVAFETAISVVEILEQVDAEALDTRIEEALDYVTGIVFEAAPPEEVETSIKAELRYRGQGLQFIEPLSTKTRFADALKTLRERFEAHYLKTIGFILPAVPIELATISVSARQRRLDMPPRLQAVPERTTEGSTRSIYDLAAQKALDYKEVARNAMGTEIMNGPVVIPEVQTTTLVRPGWQVHREIAGYLVMERITP